MLGVRRMSGYESLSVTVWVGRLGLEFRVCGELRRILMRGPYCKYVKHDKRDMSDVAGLRIDEGLSVLQLCGHRSVLANQSGSR